MWIHKKGQSRSINICFCSTTSQENEIVMWRWKEMDWRAERWMDSGRKEARLMRRSESKEVDKRGTEEEGWRFSLDIKAIKAIKANPHYRPPPPPPHPHPPHTHTHTHKHATSTKIPERIVLSVLIALELPCSLLSLFFFAAALELSGDYYMELYTSTRHFPPSVPELTKPHPPVTAVSAILCLFSSSFSAINQQNNILNIYNINYFIY